MNAIALRQLHRELTSCYENNEEITLTRAEDIETALEEYVTEYGQNQYTVELFELVELTKSEFPDRIDGVKVWPNEAVYFDDWLKVNGYFDADQIRTNLIEDEADEEEIYNIMQDLECQFMDWCDDNGLTGFTI